MKLFETTKCCFVVKDLRLGALIIGVLMVVGIIVNAPGSSLHRIITLAIYALAWCALLYGILSKRTEFMIPALIVGFLGLCVSMVLLLVIPIVGFFFLDTVQQFIDEQRKGLSQKIDIAPFMVLYWFYVAISAVWQWHFTSVIYSLRKSMLEKRQQRLANVTYPNLESAK